MNTSRARNLTRDELAEGVRRGSLTESIRDIGHLCTCPWAGPILNQGPHHWRRTGTNPACPVRAHSPDRPMVVARAA